VKLERARLVIVRDRATKREKSRPRECDAPFTRVTPIHVLPKEFTLLSMLNDHGSGGRRIRKEGLCVCLTGEEKERAGWR